MKIIQMTNMTHTQMMGFIIQADNGQIIVIDGGAAGNGNELRRIVDALGGHIDLWLLTHPHSDHYEAIIEAIEAGISYETLGASILPDEWGVNEAIFAKELYTWNAFWPKIADRFFEVKTGQKFTFGSLTLDVLAGANPDITVNAFNNQSCVFRLEENGFVMLFLGDLGVEAGERLVAGGTDLHADGVQMAHHGQQGVNEAFYQAVHPIYAFWPTPDWLWNNCNAKLEPGKGPFKTPEVIRWMGKMGTINIAPFEHTVIFDPETGTVQPF